MNAATMRMVYDQMAAAVPTAVKTFAVKIDDVVSWTGSGMMLSSSTARHLFAAGSMGNRNQGGIDCRTDTFKNSNNETIAESILEESLNGCLITISNRVYRIMHASIIATGGLIRITLDSPEAVGE